MSLPKILIVEDKVKVREALCDFLHDVAEVITAATPEEAKALIQSNPDLKLISVDGSLVQHGDGVEVVKFAVEQGFPGPIVAMSADDNTAMIQAGATHHVLKPRIASVLWELIDGL
ncbi:MAG TPA: response regulator [Patescibacteria group bacterium]|nr:response regulator [Patescibacteria group bacterium]